MSRGFVLPLALYKVTTKNTCYLILERDSDIPIPYTRTLLDPGLTAQVPYEVLGVGWCDVLIVFVLSTEID